MQTLFMLLLLLVALILIGLVLIQRGKGGGLAGAFGGMGGQSAFGSRGAEKVVYVTIGVAAAWILLCMLTVWVFRVNQSNFAERFQFGGNAPAASESPKTDQPAGGGAAPAGDS